MKAVAYYRPTKQFSEAKQVATLEPYAVPARYVYVEGRDGETLEAAIQALRKGWALIVARLHLLVGSGERRPRAALWETIKEIEARGAIVVEAATGRSSTIERDDMIADAIEWVSGQSRGVSGAENGSRFGRPPMEFNAAVKAEAERLYFDRRLKNRELPKLLPEGVSLSRCYDWFGGRSERSAKFRKK